MTKLDIFIEKTTVLLKGTKTTDLDQVNKLFFAQKVV